MNRSLLSMFMVAFAVGGCFVVQAGCAMSAPESESSQDQAIAAPAFCPRQDLACPALGNNLCAACEQAGGTLDGIAAANWAGCYCHGVLFAPWENQCLPWGPVDIGNVGRSCTGKGGYIPPAGPSDAGVTGKGGSDAEAQWD
jgi:hypothetical protein